MLLNEHEAFWIDCIRVACNDEVPEPTLARAQALLLTGGSAADVAAALNQHGVVTRQGLSWSRTNVRAPLKEAQQIAREELNAAMKSNPNFGRFA